ncbi:FMN-binding negative transcriptional regulator [Streptomyces sp. NPDC054844]
MYARPEYRTGSLDVQLDLIERVRFGLVTVVLDGALKGAHLPFLLDRGPEHGPRGRLRAHLATANPVTEALRRGGEVMVAFLGAHAYLSPNDYASGPYFPTWDYEAAHVYGRPRMLDREGQLQLLRDLITRQESERHPEEPWALERMPRQRTEDFLTRISAFELPIDRIEAIGKFSQEKSAADIQAQISAFRARGEGLPQEMADLIERYNPDKTAVSDERPS